MSGKISCAICNAQVHSIQHHLRDFHKEMTLAEYQEKFPGFEVLSASAKMMIEKKRAEAASVATAVQATDENATGVPFTKKNFHEVFDLGAVKTAMSVRGSPIPITVFGAHEHQELVAAVSPNYVYEIDELKNVILAMELNIPCYIWGHKGSGKSELLEQVMARTNRPSVRVQHTVNTEESHIVGQWTVKAGETVFEYGPLPLAMINGWVYIADEYDFALPSVLAVYQAVLEGKSLMIKEAPAEKRTVKPHANFRFAANGNTNGSGDESGLYQGTLIQNSANYDRFGMVVHKQYMDRKAESLILQNHCKLIPSDAEKMVEFAKLVREAYDGAKISDTISPRTLIYASRIGLMRGSFRQGLALSFSNKLSSVDREVCEGLAQRVFGGAA